MKKPKKIKRYCPKCKKHTLQKLVRQKTGKKRGALKKGRYRQRKMEKGYGGHPYPKMESGGKFGAKTSKKLDLRFKCEVCSKENVQKKGIRAKKFELV